MILYICPWYVKQYDSRRYCLHGKSAELVIQLLTFQVWYSLMIVRHTPTSVKKFSGVFRDWFRGFEAKPDRTPTIPIAAARYFKSSTIAVSRLVDLPFCKAPTAYAGQRRSNLRLRDGRFGTLTKSRGPVRSVPHGHRGVRRCDSRSRIDTVRENESLMSWWKWVLWTV